jgi:hypothetical protein
MRPAPIVIQRIRTSIGTAGRESSRSSELLAVLPRSIHSSGSRASVDLPLPASSRSKRRPSGSVSRLCLNVPERCAVAHGDRGAAGDVRAESSDVPAGPREARDESNLDGIHLHDHHDRIVPVASRAACVARGPAARITSTLRATRSAASSPSIGRLRERFFITIVGFQSPS